MTRRTPLDPNVCMPGLALRSAMNSVSVLAGRLGLITTTSGNCVTSETGAKSLIGSYGGCLCMAGTAACPGPANRNVYPSGSALATARAAIEPPPPPMFSINTRCGSC